MNILNYNKFKTITLITFIVFIVSIIKAQEEDYLNTVIERLNGLEIELKNIQSNGSEKSNVNNRYTNAIASHEQRLIELEEEIRNLNGSLEE